MVKAHVLIGLLILIQFNCGYAQDLPEYLTPYESLSNVPAMYAGDSVFADLNADGTPELIVCGLAGSAGAFTPNTVVLEKKSTGFQVSPISPKLSNV